MTLRYLFVHVFPVTPNACSFFLAFRKVILMLCKGDGWRFSPPTPASDAKDINLKLRLPNELEMGLSQSLQKEEDQENLDRSGKKYQHRNIHMDMNTHELQFHFGVSNPHEVDKENYQIVKSYQ